MRNEFFDKHYRKIEVGDTIRIPAQTEMFPDMVWMPMLILVNRNHGADEDFSFGFLQDKEVHFVSPTAEEAVSKLLATYKNYTLKLRAHTTSTGYCHYMEFV